MGAMASHITSLTIVYSNFYSGADQRKRQSPTSLAFVRGIHRWPARGGEQEGTLKCKELQEDRGSDDNEAVVKRKANVLTACLS